MPRLRVDIIEGRNLAAKECVLINNYNMSTDLFIYFLHCVHSLLCSLGISSDPYIIVKVNGSQVHKTKTILKNLCPKWHETIHVHLNNPAAETVAFYIYDYDFVSKDGT